MALPKSSARSADNSSAYLEASVDIASISANTTLDVQVPAPKNFQYGKVVLVFLRSDQAALNAGVQVNAVGRVVNNSGKKIEFRVSNHTAAPIDPAAKVFQFLQL